MKARIVYVFVLVLSSLILIGERAFAASPAADIEADPIAFALGGYSLHAGVAKARWRVDAGAFAMQFPEALHGNANLNVGFHGFGLKVQYFLLAEQMGAFVGAGAGVNQLEVQHRRTRVAATRAQLGVGVHAGWRIALPRGFYATPWVGLDYAPNANPVSVSGATYDNSRWSVFPTVHLGYQFN